MADVHGHNDHSGDNGAAHRKVIWKTFWILSVLTAVEFIIAFTMHHGPLRISIFVIMTLVKAFYIVGEFMHLKHEVKGLIWSIVFPCVFVLWLLGALMMEGNFLFKDLHIFR